MKQSSTTPLNVGSSEFKHLRKLSDEELVVSYANGENKAFDVILERYKDRLYTYIFCCVKDEARADDIFQETFVKAITTIKQGRYIESGKLISWLTRIAHNIVIDSHRADKNNTTISSDLEDYDVLNDRRLAERNIEDEMIQTQIYDDVRRMVELLPPTQKEVVMLRFYRDMSFKDIAEQTGVSINTALGRMRYALLNLRRIADEKNIILTL